jgi:hypothetical protein
MRIRHMATLALSVLAAGALSIAACPSAHAQAPATGGPQISGLADLTDMRVEIVKAALQLSPDQEKFWPAIEDAIRTRAKNRQNRVANVAAR